MSNRIADQDRVIVPTTLDIRFASVFNSQLNQEDMRIVIIIFNKLDKIQGKLSMTMLTL